MGLIYLRRWGSILVFGWLLLACNFLGFGAVPTPTGQPPVSETPLPPQETPNGTRQPEASTPVAPPAEAPAVVTSDVLVVYVKNGNLWLWSSDGAVQLTTGGEAFSPRLSPDRTMIAFLRPADEFHVEIWAVNLDGSNERRLVGITDLDAIGGGVRSPNAVAINPYQFEWVPGSQTLAFNTHQVYQGPGLELLDDLNLVETGTGKVSSLLLSGWGGMFYYSPDGEQIAITQPERILLAEADGSNYRELLAYPPVTTYSEYRYYARPYWSPNGRLLRVAIPPADPLALQANPTALWSLAVDGSPAVQDGVVMSTPFFDQPVSYAPDLERVAFLRPAGEPAENRRELILAAYDGGGEWQYAAVSLLRFLAWAPDGARFVYLLGDDQQAWLGDLAAAPAPLFDGAYGVHSLQWLDNQRFLVARQEGESFGLYLGMPGKQPLLLDTISGGPPDFDF